MQAYIITSSLQHHSHLLTLTYFHALFHVFHALINIGKFKFTYCIFSKVKRLVVVKLYTNLHHDNSSSALVSLLTLTYFLLY